MKKLILLVALGLLVLAGCFFGRFIFHTEAIIPYSPPSPLWGCEHHFFVRFCKDWKEADFSSDAIDADNLAKASASATNPELPEPFFSREDFDQGERLTPCDCMVMLYSRGHISYAEAEAHYDPDECHDMTRQMFLAAEAERQ